MENEETQELEPVKKFVPNCSEKIEQLYATYIKDGQLVESDLTNLDAEYDLLIANSDSIIRQLDGDNSEMGMKLRTLYNDYIHGDAASAITMADMFDENDTFWKHIVLTTYVPTLAIFCTATEEGIETAPKKQLFKTNPITLSNIDKSPLNGINMDRRTRKGKALPAELKNLPNMLDSMPKTYTKLSKFASLATAARKRSAFQGKEYHGVSTIESLYADFGEALVYTCTSLFKSAGDAFTKNGARNAAGKITEIDFANIKPDSKEDESVTALMQAAFKKQSNVGAINVYRNINDKMVIDSALCVFYEDLTDEQRNNISYINSDADLYNMAIAKRFTLQFKELCSIRFKRYNNIFLNAIERAVTKEQNPELDWYENKVTGDRKYRRGRLAGGLNKFMNSAAMKWMDNKLASKKWLSIWCLPKLCFGTMKLVSSPAVTKARHKMWRAYTDMLRSFSNGVAECFNDMGEKADITLEDVQKAIDDGMKEIDNIINAGGEETHVDNESYSKYNSFLEFLAEATIDDSLPSEKELQNLSSLNTRATDKLASDDDKTAYKERYAALFTDEVQHALQSIPDENREEYAQYFDAIAAYNEFAQQEAADEKLNKSGTKSDNQYNTTVLEVGNKSIEICESVFDVIHQYVARQWNLLQIHAVSEPMPLCAFYEAVVLQKELDPAVVGDTNVKKSESVCNVSLGDILRENILDKKFDADLKNTNAVKNTNFNADKENGDAAGTKTNLNRSVRTGYSYPLRVNGGFKYHGIKLPAVSNNAGINGYGEFVSRFTKLAKMVSQFDIYVQALGNQSSEKTFHTESVEPVNEVLGTVVGASVAGAGIVGAVKGLLKKEQPQMREFTPMHKFNTINLANYKAGVSYVANQCVSPEAAQQFSKINDLISALGSANFPNQKSIHAMANALNTFVSQVKAESFKPCKTVIKNDMVERFINNRANPDSTELGSIKGFYIANWSAATEFARQVGDYVEPEPADISIPVEADTTDTTDDVTAGKTAEKTPVDGKEPAPEEKTGEKSAETTGSVPADASEKPEDNNAVKKPEDNNAVKKPEDSSSANKPEDNSSAKKPEDSAPGKSDETASVSEKPAETADTAGKPAAKTGGMRKASNFANRQANYKKQHNQTKRVPGKKKNKSTNGYRESTDAIVLTDLVERLSAINNIDWKKEIYNG